MKEAMKEDIKDFAKVYAPIIAIMLMFAGLAAIDGHANGAAACAGIATIAAAMYAVTIVLVGDNRIELVPQRTHFEGAKRRTKCSESRMQEVK